MSDFDSLREDLASTFMAINDYAQAQRRHAESVSVEVERLWADNAELRDELHALANRVENLTRALTTAPAEVAAKIVTDANQDTLREVFTCRLNPGCNISRPHIHQDDGAVIYVEDAATADAQLQQRAFMKAVWGGRDA